MKHKAYNETKEARRAQTYVVKPLCALRASVVFVTIGFLLRASCFANQPTSLADADLSRIRFDQHLNDRISLDLLFTDESSHVVQLQRYFHDKPVVLALGYYGCPMLCGLVLNGMVEAFQDLKATSGKDFEVIFISIDPHETPALARDKKSRYLKRYGRPEAAAGWHFLCGDENSLQKVAKEIGFCYAYDAASKQYAHPSGFVVLTANGEISRYFFGVTYSARELSSSLKEAQNNRVGSPIQKLLLLCFHYSPVTGKYGAFVMLLVRFGAAATLIGIIAPVLIHLRRDRRKRLLQARGGSG